MADSRSPMDDFRREAEAPQGGFLGELWDYLRHNKKWWLTPIILVLVIVGVAVLVGGTAFAPFIYTLF